jgi:EAL domain-containing protein (putative c-di-GMP-specific phosphodiesterase class I)
MPAIAVNLSVRQLTDEHLAKRLQETMDSYNVAGNLIKLEITESAFIGYSYQKVLAVMEPLIARGISFHLDDFGTGYSNLAYVINLPFSGIKLDKTLVWDIVNNSRMQSFVEKLIRAVSHMGAKVIVEGIETEQQLAFLRHVGCDMVQGFLFSPPLDADDFISLLAKNRPFPLTNQGALG